MRGCRQRCIAPAASRKRRIESHFILEFLELKHPIPPLPPADVDGVLAAKRLEVLCDGVCDALVATFFERQRPQDHQSREWTARQRRKIDGGLREIARLVGTRQWAVGDRFGLGDIAACTVTGYATARFPDIDWRGQYPALAQYADRLAERPSLKATVPHPQAISDKVV